VDDAIAVASDVHGCDAREIKEHDFSDSVSGDSSDTSRDCSSDSASGCSSDSSSDESSDIDIVVDMALAPGTRRYRGRINGCAAPASIDAVDFKTRYSLTMDKFNSLHSSIIRSVPDCFQGIVRCDVAGSGEGCRRNILATWMDCGANGETTSYS